MKRVKLIYFILAASLLMLSSCRKDNPVIDPATTRKVMILYSCGYNNLSPSLRQDIKDIAGSRVPDISQRDQYKILVFSHLSRTSTDFTTPVAPTLVDIYRNSEGTVVMDTVKIYPSDIYGVSAKTMKGVLTDIQSMYPSKEYGMIFSSHATGWLPLGYTSKASSSSDDVIWMSADRAERHSAPSSSYANMPQDWDTKTIGAHFEGNYSVSVEMELRDFASAIPMHLKYLVMDACLAGGIEAAYQLKDNVDFYAASQTEILADGFPYEKMTERLLFPEVSDVQGLCEDFYHHYEKSNATISLVDCRKLDDLAMVCCTLFDKYSEQLDNLDASAVQSYYRYNWHWFYDLEDILLKAGINNAEAYGLSKALEAAVPYKACTPTAFSIRMKHHCGLSMYLPCKGAADLDEFYRGFAWNEDTALVK